MKNFKHKNQQTQAAPVAIDQASQQPQPSKANHSGSGKKSAMSESEQIKLMITQTAQLQRLLSKAYPVLMRSQL